MTPANRSELGRQSRRRIQEEDTEVLPLCCPQNLVKNRQDFIHEGWGHRLYAGEVKGNLPGLPRKRCRQRSLDEPRGITSHQSSSSHQIVDSHRFHLEFASSRNGRRREGTREESSPLSAPLHVLAALHHSDAGMDYELASGLSHVFSYPIQSDPARPRTGAAHTLFQGKLDGHPIVGNLLHQIRITLKRAPDTDAAIRHRTNEPSTLLRFVELDEPEGTDG